MSFFVGRPHTPDSFNQVPCWAEINTVEHGVEDGSNICELFPSGTFAFPKRCRE
jgi:hypothetical protein